MNATLYVILRYAKEEAITHLKNNRLAEINNTLTALIDNGVKEGYKKVTGRTCDNNN